MDLSAPIHDEQTGVHQNDASHRKLAPDCEAARCLPWTHLQWGGAVLRTHEGSSSWSEEKDSADMLNVEMRLVIESGIKEDVILEKARSIWCEVYSPPRASGTTSRRPRIDKGVKRKFQDI